MVLRAASGPLTSLEIAKRILALHKLQETPASVSMKRKLVGAALWKLKVLEWVREVPQEGEYKRWLLV